MGWANVSPTEKLKLCCALQRTQPYRSNWPVFQYKLLEENGDTCRTSNDTACASLTLMTEQSLTCGKDTCPPTPLRQQPLAQVTKDSPANLLLVNVSHPANEQSLRGASDSRDFQNTGGNGQ